MASQPAPSDPFLLTADEFLQITFPPGVKAELEDGVIRMMGGGSTGHARVQMNLYRFLGAALRGSGCRPYGSDAAITTADRAVRYPDLTIACGPQLDQDASALTDPRVVVEVLSPSTRVHDTGAKLAEYQRMPSIEAILLVDPASERVRLLHRAGPEEWHDRWFAQPADIALPSLGLVIPHAEIFARD